MTTGTALARFEPGPGVPGVMERSTTCPGRPRRPAYARAYAAVGSPWLSQATQPSLRASQREPRRHARQRLERQYALTPFMLGGPDGQVM